MISKSMPKNTYNMSYPYTIDEKLYKEDLEIIKLHYDKASKFLALWNWSIWPFLAATIATAINSWINWWFLFFLIYLLINIMRTGIWNIRINIYFNTLVKKTKELKK